MDALKCRAFLATAELGSMSAAAESLGYTQSGITRMIRSLEEELAASDLGRFLYLTDKYTFKEPVLYEFIQSDFLDFNEFVQAIREDP